MEEVAGLRSDLGSLVRRAAAHSLRRRARRTRPRSRPRPHCPRIHRRAAWFLGFSKAEAGSRPDRTVTIAAVIAVWPRWLTRPHPPRGSAARSEIFQQADQTARPRADRQRPLARLFQ